MKNWQEYNCKETLSNKQTYRTGYIKFELRALQKEIMKIQFLKYPHMEKLLDYKMFWYVDGSLSVPVEVLG